MAHRALPEPGVYRFDFLSRVMFMYQKRVTPIGITLLTKPDKALRSLSSVALSSLSVKAIPFYHKINPMLMYNSGGGGVQFER